MFMYFKKKKDLLLSVVRRCHGEGKGRLTKTEEMSGSKGKDQLDKVLTYSWTAIFFTTLIAFVSLIVGMVRLEVDFLDDGAWENDVDTVSKNRAYIIAIWTMLLSFGVSSYGFWRSCISVRTIQMLDVIFSGGVSATGSMVFICFILFFDWPQVSNCDIFSSHSISLSYTMFKYNASTSSSSNFRSGMRLLKRVLEFSYLQCVAFSCLFFSALLTLRPFGNILRRIN